MSDATYEQLLNEVDKLHPHVAFSAWIREIQNASIFQLEMRIRMKNEHQKLLSFSRRTFLGVSQSDVISKNHSYERKHKNTI